MSDAHLLTSLVQAIAWLSVGLPVGDRLLGRRDAGGVERALFAVAGAVGFSILLMLAHLVTGGRIFANTWVVPMLAIAVLFWGRRSFRSVRLERRALVSLAVLAVLLVAIFVMPAIRGGTSVRAGDPPWHLGWTEQLLGGDPLPTGLAPPSVARNAYPWGFHAVLATLVRLVPGSDPLGALDAVFFVLVAAIPLAGAALARLANAKAGWGGAVAVSLIGGFGWIWARAPEFSSSPRAARFGADLVVASPNSVYELFPPGLPRELGLVLAGVALVGLATVRDQSVAARVRLGLLVGLVGLVSVPMFVTAFAWLIAVTVAASKGIHRRRSLLWSGGAALALFGAWLAPVAANYAAHSGFVDITPRLGKEWPLPVALGAWGLLLPLAIVGVVQVRKRGTEGGALFAAALATGALLVASIARGVFHWGLAGNATLLHQGRMWPPAHLLAAAFGGVAIFWFGQRLSGKRRVLVGVVLGSAAVASLLMASLALGTTMSRGNEGFVYDNPDVVGEESFVQVAAAELTPDSVVEVNGPGSLAFLLFQFSGARLSSFDDPRLPVNDVRIRYRDLAAEWDASVARKGFVPTYVVSPLRNGPGVPSGLATGSYLGVDYVLTPAE